MIAFRILFLLGLFLAASATTLTQAERDELLEHHRLVRTEVSPPAANMRNMVWDTELEAKAQKWAENCVFEHSPREPGTRPTGENLAYFFPTGLPVVNASQLWAGEKAHYTYDGRQQHCEQGKVCGHYTQMIWWNSPYLGCGADICSINGIQSKLVVCNYAPPGNVIGQTPYSVDPRFLESGPEAVPNNGWCTYCPNPCVRDGKLCPVNSEPMTTYPCSPDCKDKQSKSFCNYVIGLSTQASGTREKCNVSTYNSWLRANCAKSCEYCVCSEK
eukprot:m.7826 g.7826  ORF g.7826 m.7826 type:complete len:273 (+) comp19743_c0_seq1:711-1529(+)